MDTLRSQECDAIYQEGKKKPPVPLPGLACSCCSPLRHHCCNGLRPGRAGFLHKRKLLLSTTRTFWLSEAVQKGFSAVKASFPCFSSSLRQGLLPHHQVASPTVITSPAVEPVELTHISWSPQTSAHSNSSQGDKRLCSGVYHECFISTYGKGRAASEERLLLMENYLCSLLSSLLQSPLAEAPESLCNGDSAPSSAADLVY